MVRRLNATAKVATYAGLSELQIIFCLKGFLTPKFFSNADFLKNNAEKIFAETKN